MHSASLSQRGFAMNDCQISVAPAIIAQTFACDRALAEVVAAKARYHDYPPRTTIVEAGSAMRQVYLMIAGRARMLAFAIDGRLVVIQNFGAGDIFGEGGLIDEHATTDEVSSVDSVTTGAFPTPTFIALMTNYSCIALAMSRVLVARLTTTTRRMVEGATLSAIGRIHAELLRQARASTGMTIKPAPVLSDFALTVQSTRETVSRAINALQKRGIIARTEEALTVIAPHRLEELIY